MEGSNNGFFASLGKHKYVMAALLLIGASLIAFGFFSNSGKKADSLTEYETSLEERMEKLCLCVSGIEEARVLVTVERQSEDKGLYATQSPPAVIGAAAVVTGGDDPAVVRKVTELISSSLGIPKNRVSVAPYK